jgi:predicted ATP-dependent Lon-type protease
MLVETFCHVLRSGDVWRMFVDPGIFAKYRVMLASGFWTMLLINADGVNLNQSTSRKPAPGWAL